MRGFFLDERDGEKDATLGLEELAGFEVIINGEVLPEADFVSKKVDRTLSLFELVLDDWKKENIRTIQVNAITLSGETKEGCEVGLG